MTTALRDAIDHTALGWVKPEIDETLRQARLEIEAFVEAPADVSPMRACAGYLHQVQGTLRMLELQAPAMVAGEMEQLASALLEGVPGGRLTALDTLAQAIGFARHHVHHPIAGCCGSGLQLTHEMQLLVPEEALEAGAEVISQSLVSVLQTAQPEDQVNQAGEDQDKGGKQPGDKGRQDRGGLGIHRRSIPPSPVN